MNQRRSDHVSRDKSWPQRKAQEQNRPAAIGIVVECRTCGAEFEPHPNAYRQGDWRVCSLCQTRGSQHQEEPAA